MECVACLAAQGARSLQSVGSVARKLSDDPAAPDGDDDSTGHTTSVFAVARKIRAVGP